MKDLKEFAEKLVKENVIPLYPFVEFFAIMKRQFNFCPKSGRITQLGECHLDKVEVAGSSPVLPTIIKA